MKGTQRGQKRMVLRSPLNKCRGTRDKGASFAERRSRFNGMVIRKGGGRNGGCPGLGKGEEQGEVRDERVDNSMA